MDLLRIMHCADFHIGMRFSDYASRDALREARLSAVDRIVEAAGGADSHLISVSGDLFDRVSMSKADVSRVAASLSEFPGRAVLVLPGNHDYAGAESTLWRDFRDAAGDHVRVLDRAEPFDLAEYGIPAVVYPAPCDAKHSGDNRIGWVREAIAGERIAENLGSNSDTGGAASGPQAAGRPWRIGMAHGSIEGVSPDFDGRYFPMRREELQQAGVDVWLLGHSHISWPESLADSPRILNPGTPEPDGFDCAHRGHAFIVELGGSSATDTGDSPESAAADGHAPPSAPPSEPAPISVRRITTGAFRFRQERRTLSSGADVEALDQVADGSESASTILRLELEGRLDAESLERLEQTIAAVRQRVAELDLRHENVHEAVTRGRIEQEYPDGSFASTLLLSFADEDDREALEMAWDIVGESRQ